MKFIYAMIIITGLAISITGYYVNRWWNWNFSYKHMVEETIKPYIDESRKREELLYREVKNLDYEISILTDLQRQMK